MASNEEYLIRRRRRSMDDILNMRILVLGSESPLQFTVSNCILGRRQFMTDACNLSQSLKNHVEIDDRKISVINTPSFHKDFLPNHIKKELQRCVCLSSPGLHAVLITLDLENISPADASIMNCLSKHFGENVLNYTILLLCHKGKQGNPDFEDRLQTDRNFREIMEKYGVRYHYFNMDSEAADQANALLKKIDSMLAEHGDQFFTNKDYEKTEDSIRKEEKFIEKGRQKEIKRELLELGYRHQGEELEKKNHQYGSRVKVEIREQAERIILDRCGFASRAVDYAAAVCKGIAVGILGGAVLGQVGVMVGGVIGAVLGIMVGWIMRTR